MKRLFDIALVLLAVPLWLPLLGLVAALVRVWMGTPVLFRQTRPGKDTVSFELIKFRTMSEERDAEGRLLPDAERLTALGRFLRRTSLDELPELWLVLRGKMSLVGPRPLLPQYLDRYTPEQARRHEVRPGLTGLAQVSGRNALDWESRLALDVEYVDRQSFWLDLRILALTLWRVVWGSGVSAPGEATVEEFKGQRAAHGDERRETSVERQRKNG